MASGRRIAAAPATMLFNSLAFLLFFPLYAAAYFATRGRARLWVSLVASYVFYCW